MADRQTSIVDLFHLLAEPGNTTRNEVDAINAHLAAHHSMHGMVNEANLLEVRLPGPVFGFLLRDAFIAGSTPPPLPAATDAHLTRANTWRQAADMLRADAMLRRHLKLTADAQITTSETLEALAKAMEDHASSLKAEGEPS